MKKNPELNKSSDSAIYGMAASIPDQNLLQYFIHIVQDVQLDIIWWIQIIVGFWMNMNGLDYSLKNIKS
jgi:hypothetical protein